MRAALAALGIDRFVLAIHDASFPAFPEEDIGRGSPYSRGGGAFFELLATGGFDGVQLGPQGKTSRSNPSPYDASFLARSHLSVALAPLVDEPGWAGLLPPGALARLVDGRPAGARRRARHAWAWDASGRALDLAYRRYVARPQSYPAIAEEWRRLVPRRADWLEADGLYEALVIEHGADDPARWSRGPTAALDRRLYDPPRGAAGPARDRRRALARTHADLIARNTFRQVLLSSQHRLLRAHLGRLGLALYADLPVGVGLRDAWRYHGLWMPGYALGAPPSRTNPEGQSWGYPILDPSRRARADGGDGPALRLFDRRVDRLFDDFDGLRVDHPHGLVCPWVYRVPADDLAASVRAGARLFESPDLADHPALARLALVRPRDLAPSEDRPARYADDWVRRLSPRQVGRFAVLFDRLMERAAAHGRRGPDVVAEVLSTCPRPLAAVLARHGLGRLRVSPKADPRDQKDPYRTENAAPADWLTLGTHDTVPIWRAVEGIEGERHVAWCAYLAGRLAPDESQRAPLARALGRDRRRLVQAMFADLFVGPARHVTVFFADLLGLTDTYNVPGVVSDRNWTLRVPPETLTRTRATRLGGGLDIPSALAVALRARVRGARGELADLAASLERGRGS